MPTSLTPLERWLGLNLIASKATKIGTDACAIAATPESMCVSPHAISVKGIAPLIAPNTKPSRQAPRTCVTAARPPVVTARNASSNRPPIRRRSAINTVGSKPRTPTLMNRYDEPQIAASVRIRGP